MMAFAISISENENPDLQKSQGQKLQAKGLTRGDVWKRLKRVRRVGYTQNVFRVKSAGGVAEMVSRSDCHRISASSTGRARGAIQASPAAGAGPAVPATS